MTPNDLRVLKAVTTASREDSDVDGYAPHGAADWTAIRRLVAAGSVEMTYEYGECATCHDPHEVKIYRVPPHMITRGAR